MKKIVNLLILSLAVLQIAINTAYSAEDPSNAYKYTEAYNLQGEIITYNYDNLGRKIATFFPDGSEEIIEYFDGGGYALTKTNQQGQFVSRLEYDQQGLMVKAIDDYGYESISPPYAQGQADIATQLDLGPPLELPTIIVEAPYPYPNLPTFEDFVNQTYYISDSSAVITVARVEVPYCNGSKGPGNGSRKPLNRLKQSSSRKYLGVILGVISAIT